VDVQHLVSASLLAQEAFQLRRKRRRAAVAAWIGLALVALSPAAVAYRAGACRCRRPRNDRHL